MLVNLVHIEVPWEATSELVGGHTRMPGPGQGSACVVVLAELVNENIRHAIEFEFHIKIK
jgi:hypothetical protein